MQVSRDVQRYALAAGLGFALMATGAATLVLESPFSRFVTLTLVILTTYEFAAQHLRSRPR